MKIQIDFPDDYDKELKIFQIKNDLKTKAEAIVKLSVEKLKENGRARSKWL